MEYVLMNKDKPVLSFETQKNKYGSVQAVAEQNASGALPFGFSDIDKWLENRKPPKHRKNIASLLQQLEIFDADGYISVTRAASLNDTFWVKEKNEDIDWQEVSLYTNEFDDNIAKIAFEGGYATAGLSTTTPELSLGGAFAKCWIRDQEDIFLMKRGSETYGREVFSEYYAAQLAKEICNESVDYDIVMHNSYLANKCRIFTSEKNGFNEIMSLVKNPYKVTSMELLEIFSDISSEAADEYRQMVVLDALILNVDRHLGNFGVLFDNDTMQVKSMAPVFDNNRALLFDFSDEQIKKQDMRSIIDVLPRIGMDFNEEANKMLTSSIKTTLKNLRGFTFKRHEKYNLSEARLQKLEQLIEIQADKILNEVKVYVAK